MYAYMGQLMEGGHMELVAPYACRLAAPMRRQLYMALLTNLTLAEVRFDMDIVMDG